MIGSHAARSGEPRSADALPGVRLSDDGIQLTPEALLQLFENLPVAISITTGPEHRFLYTNSRYRRTLLPGSGDPTGRAIADVFGSSIGAGIYQLRDQVFRQGRILTQCLTERRCGTSRQSIFRTQLAREGRSKRRIAAQDGSERRREGGRSPGAS